MYVAWQKAIRAQMEHVKLYYLEEVIVSPFELSDFYFIFIF